MDIEVTHDNSPKALQELLRMTREMYEKQAQVIPEEDRLMTLEQYREYEYQKTGRKPAKQTVYDRVNKGELPHEKHGKYLYFRKSSIDTYYDNGRQA